MKKVVIPVFILLLAVCLFACKKDMTGTANTALDASKTSAIKKGEPVVFSLPQAGTGSTVNWSVSPSANTQINSSGNTAAVLFGAKGSYTITAVYGATIATSTVSVNDSVYHAGDAGNGGSLPPTNVPLVSGEVIHIAVTRIDSINYSGLVFAAQTSTIYNCIGNSLITEGKSGTNSYTISYSGVSIPGGCTGSSAKAAGFCYLYPISTGNNTLTIEVGSTTYTGTITRTANGYTINWPNTTGVVISPTSL